MCTPDSALTGLVHCLAETTSQVGSHAVAVTSPGKSMVAGASKGRGIGRGNFYPEKTTVVEINTSNVTARKTGYSVDSLELQLQLDDVRMTNDRPVARNIVVSTAYLVK